MRRVAEGGAAVLVLVGVLALPVVDGDDLATPLPPADEVAAATSSTTTTAVPSTTTTAPPPGPVTIAFGGDVHFEGPLAADPASALLGVARVLAGADLAVVNMETALGFGGTPEPKAYTFRAPPSALEAFRAAGVDVVSAANNHGMDFGPEGLQETLQAEVDEAFPIIGIGHDEDEAYAPFVADVRGHRIAVVAASQVLDSELIDRWTAGPDQAGVASAYRVDRLVRAVTEAGAAADTVVVFLHWGREREVCPTSSQQALAASLVEAGADIVVGAHAHRVQGGGRLGGAVVHYGLGNFAFDTRSVEGSTSGVFVVTVEGADVVGYEWVPARLRNGRPSTLSGAEADAGRAAWEGLRGCTDLVA